MSASHSPQKEASDLSEALPQSNDTPTMLQLLGLRISQASIENVLQIAAQHGHNADLRVLCGAGSLNLSNLPLGDDAVPFILRIMENTNLVSLNLANTGISEKGTRKIANALETNNTLRDLNLHGNGVASDDIQRFSTYMNKRSNLNISLGFATGSTQNRYMLCFQKATQTSLAELCSANITSETKKAEAEAPLLLQLHTEILKLNIQFTCALLNEIIHQIESRSDFFSSQQAPRGPFQPLLDQLDELGRNPPTTLKALQTKLSSAIESVTGITEVSDRISRLLDTLRHIKGKADKNSVKFALQLSPSPY
jgi:hypothetical protein